MKKWLCFLLAGVLLLSLTACKKEEKIEKATKPQTDPTQIGETIIFTRPTEPQPTTPPEKPIVEETDYLTKYPVLYKSGEHYAIYTNTDPVVQFYYIVKDQNGELLDQGLKDYRGSFGFSYRNGLLVMEYGYGGQGSRHERYYDVENRRISSLFPDPVATSDTLVAYFSHDSYDNIVLTVQDIFDELSYFVQLPGPYSDWVFKDDGSYTGEFSEDNTQLTLTYPVGDKGETVTETVILPGRSAEDQQLLQVLRNEKPFVTEAGQTVYLQDHKIYGVKNAVVKNYAWVDMDGDGANELVAYIVSDLAYIVFHRENGQIRGYEIGLRSMQGLNTDGTHTGSGGAGVNVYLKGSFQNGKFETTELAYYCDYPGQQEYRVGGKAVTKEEFAVFNGEFQKKPDVIWYPNTAPTQTNRLYAEFLAGNIPALENGNENTLNTYLRRMGYPQVGHWQYTFLDMTGDGVPELCVKHLELYIFTIKDGRVCHWYTDSNMYTMPLKDGNLMMERHGAAPTHINYEYYTLDENGKETFRIAFSWWDGKTVEEGKIYPDRYYVNEQEVTKEEYDRKVGIYLAAGKEQVVWYHHDGEVM